MSPWFRRRRPEPEPVSEPAPVPAPAPPAEDDGEISPARLDAALQRLRDEHPPAPTTDETRQA